MDINNSNPNTISINWEDSHRCYVLVLSENTCRKDIDDLMEKLATKPTILVLTEDFLVDHFIIENGGS